MTNCYIRRGGLCSIRRYFPSSAAQDTSIVVLWERGTYGFCKSVFGSSFLNNHFLVKDLDQHWSVHLEWQTDTHTPLPKVTLHHSCNILLSDSFSMMFFVYSFKCIEVKPSCSDQWTKQSKKGKQSQFTKYRFHDSSEGTTITLNAGLTLVLAHFCRKAGKRERYEPQ